MISLRKQVSDLEMLSALSTAAVEAYRYSIECDAQYAAPAKEEHTKAHKANLSQILTALGPDPHADDFNHNRSLLRAERRDYNDLVRKYFDEMQQSLFHLQHSVTDLLGAASGQMGEQEGRLKTEIGRLGTVLKADDLSKTRKQLTAAISSLEQASEDMRVQNRAMEAQYRSEIRALQSLTADAVSETKRDTATGFLSRSEFERQLGVRLMGGCCGATAEHVAAMRTALDRAVRDGSTSDVS